MRACRRRCAHTTAVFGVSAWTTPSVASPPLGACPFPTPASRRAAPWVRWSPPAAPGRDATGAPAHPGAHGAGSDERNTAMTASRFYGPLSSSFGERGARYTQADLPVVDDEPETVAAQTNDAPGIRHVVVDANVLVNMARELADSPTGRRRELKAFVSVVHRPEVVIDGERVHLRVVLSKHIVRMAYRPLVRRGITDPKAADAVLVAARLLLGPDGLQDDTDEDYRALDRRSWTRYGTDAEDEAVLRCAEAHTAGIVTDDRDFASYLRDRKVPNWSLDGFLDALT